MRLSLLLIVCVISFPVNGGQEAEKKFFRNGVLYGEDLPHEPHYHWSRLSKRSSYQYHAEGTKPASAVDPNLQQEYHNGQLVNSYGVINVLWNGPTHNATDYTSYYQALMTDPSWMSWISTTYSVPTTYAIATPGPYAVFNGTQSFSMSRRRLTDTVIQNQLNTWLGNGNLAAPFYYNFYAVHISQDFQFSGFCSSWCAYHSFFTSAALQKQVYYAVLPYEGNCASGCLYPNDPTDQSSTKMSISHELAEFLTDPFWSGSVQGGWWDNTTSENEIADYCGWFGTPNVPPFMNGLPINYLWSNASQGCVSPPNSTVQKSAAEK